MMTDDVTKQDGAGRLSRTNAAGPGTMLRQIGRSMSGWSPLLSGLQKRSSRPGAVARPLGKAPVAKPGWTDVIAAAALLCGLASAVMSWWVRGSLWEDEIIAATHGLEKLPFFFVEIIRTDIHPFLYFLLIKAWSSINPYSDKWLLASSLVAAIGSATAVALAAYRLGGRTAALWAAAIFCVMPGFSWAASSLRMYALIPALAIGCWYVNRQALLQGGRRWLLLIVVLQTIHSYTHAIGFFFAAFFALAALAGARGNIDLRRFKRWLLIQTISFVLMMPVLVSAVMRSTEPLDSVTWWTPVQYAAQLVSVPTMSAWIVPVGFPVLLTLVVFAMSDRRTHVLTIVILFGTLLAATIAGFAGKPMFKPAVFAANVLPFLAVGASLGIARFRVARAVAAGFVLALTIDLWRPGQANRQWAENYKPAGTYIAGSVRPGDIVIVPSLSVYWGIMRYAVSFQWGEPLSVIPLPETARWVTLKQRLGPQLVSRLHLLPTTNSVEHAGVRYVVGTDGIGPIQLCNRIWLVHSIIYDRRNLEDVELPSTLERVSLEQFGRELTVSLLTGPDCSAASGQRG